MSDIDGRFVLEDVVRKKSPEILVQRGHKLADRLAAGLEIHEPVVDYPILAATKVREPIPGAVPVSGEDYYLVPDPQNLTVQGFTERLGLELGRLTTMPGVVVEPIVITIPDHGYTDAELDRLKGGVFPNAIRILPEYQAGSVGYETTAFDQLAQAMRGADPGQHPIAY